MTGTIRLTMGIASAVVAGLSFAALAFSQGATVNVQRPAADEAPIFRPFYQGVIPDEKVAEIRAALPYERITLRRSGGMVIPGGWFTLTLLKNGEAALSGTPGNPFDRTGDFVGKVSLFDFGKISHLINHAGFDRLSARYDVNWTDMQTKTVTVMTASGGTIAVADYGGAGPVELWAIEQALESIGHDIAWKPRVESRIDNR